jgi:predicted nucleotidyltransferase
MSRTNLKAELPAEIAADFCRGHYIRRLAVFGSALREDFRDQSDLDVLVEFDPGHVPGMAFFGMERELPNLLGRRVDLNTSEFLSPYFRDEVLAEAEVQYDAP